MIMSMDITKAFYIIFLLLGLILLILTAYYIELQKTRILLISLAEKCLPLTVIDYGTR